ncbi:protein argonaute 4A-like [Amaranthus tricolor]|uniref:protein argonaute 4A-like n=1 Tax=Amaranthus tricolor TaxID=29722 RepID=UPI00258E13D2|nr:protein argonaute 4A-like [Amaranthus tricolor]
MGIQGDHGAALPPPPPIHAGVVPRRCPMNRNDFGSKGQKVQLLTNHFQVRMARSDCHFYQYSVEMAYEDGTAVDAKGVGRGVIDKLHETYKTELGGKQIAYDGESTLFTLGALPRNKLQFTVVLGEQQRSGKAGNPGSPEDNEDPNTGERKRLRRPQRSKTYTVDVSYATKIPLQAITNALRGQDSEHYQEAVRVLDVVLRQHAARRGCLLVRQSFFRNEPKNFFDIGGGVLGCRGFHSSFRATQGGLSLNIDVSTTMIVQPGPVMDFLVSNQNVPHPDQIDWVKAKRMLKNLRITTKTSNLEFKITGLSDKICRDQIFELRQRNGDGQHQSVEITVHDYFVQHHNISLRYSSKYPCINVGRPKRPSYFPIEMCDLVSLQRYTKSLSGHQRASLVEKSRQKPQERMRVLTDALRASNYAADQMLIASGINISIEFAQVEGRILPAPQLKVGSGQDLVPRRGRWNFNNKGLFEPVEALDRWVIVNFSARVDMNMLSRDIVKCGQRKGMKIRDPFKVFQENHQDRRLPAPRRVENMMDSVKNGLPGPPQLILCVLPDRKICDIYGPWKRKALAEIGLVTQCISPQKLNDQYLTNVLLKINAKLGGLNSVLSIEHARNIPFVSEAPTLIIGMDVSNGSPGRTDVPSIAAVVSSRGWPLISRYRASVRTQSPKVEIIDGLFKPDPETNTDDGMIRESLLDFFKSSNKRKPENIIIFRDGVSESQFSQVLNIELDQIKEACKFLEENWNPKFTLVVAQKNHHTKFFQRNSPDNVEPGTVVDNGICHPKNNDFYMCAHAGMIGTTRPTHYQVLIDEIGFSGGDLQDLVHSLSYVYQRSTTAISVVAPVCYAHLAASQVAQFMKFDEFSDTSSSHGGVTSVGSASIPQLPRLHPNVSSSMFFC